MTTEDRVRNLLEGSAKINQMKAEASQVIKMLVGLVSRDDQQSRSKPDSWSERAAQFTENGLRWTINKAGPEIEILVYNEQDNKQVLAFERPGRTFGDIPELREISLEYVERVHKCLPRFLEEMLKAFPSLEKRTAPLFAVSR